MSKKVTLANRRRIQEMAHDVSTAESKHEELLSLKAAGQADCIPQTPVAQHQDEVRCLVASLQALYADISSRGDHNRLQFSRQIQHDMIIAEIRQAMQKRSNECAQQGYPQDRIKMICQAFLDDVRMGLNSVGIIINPLYVRKLRGKDS